MRSLRIETGIILLHTRITPRIMSHDPVRNGPKAIGELFSDLSSAAYVSRRKLIESWLRTRTKIESQCKEMKEGGKRKARPKGVGTVLPLEAEQELVVWVNDLRKEGVPISNLMLELEARDIAKAYGIDNFSAGRVSL